MATEGQGQCPGVGQSLCRAPSSWDLRQGMDDFVTADTQHKHCSPVVSTSQMRVSVTSVWFLNIQPPLKESHSRVLSPCQFPCPSLCTQTPPHPLSCSGHFLSWNPRCVTCVWVSLSAMTWRSMHMAGLVPMYLSQCVLCASRAFKEQRAPSPPCVPHWLLTLTPDLRTQSSHGLNPLASCGGDTRPAH